MTIQYQGNCLIESGHLSPLFNQAPNQVIKPPENQAGSMIKQAQFPYF
jgi:hypothetical protein